MCPRTSTPNPKASADPTPTQPTMIIHVLTALAAYATVPEPIKAVGEFLLGLLLFIGLMGRP